jgi:hypothetical protein
MSARRFIAWIIAIAFVAAALLLPTVKGPLLGDDSINTGIPGMMGYEHMGFWQFYGHYLQLTMHAGHFLPGEVLVQVTKFTLSESPFALHVANIVFICLNLVTFGLLVRRVWGSRTALIASLIALPTFQARIFFDVITEITVEDQIITEFVLLSLLAAVTYARKPTRNQLIAMLAVCAVSDFVYENSYLFAVPCALIVAFAPIPARLRKIGAGGVLGVLLVFSSIASVVHHAANIGATGEFAIHWDATAIVRTFVLQSLGGLPAIYALVNPHAGLTYPSYLVRHPVWGVLVALAVGTLTFRIALDDGSSTAVAVPKPRLAEALSLALGLILIPSILISLSQRWQLSVELGLAYQPAYISAFGWALLGGWGAERLLARIAVRGKSQPAYALRSAALGLAIVLAVLAFVVVQANRFVIGHWQQEGFKRDVLRSAWMRGMLGAVPEGGTILIDSDYPNIFGDESDYLGTRYTIFRETGRRLHLRKVDAGVDLTTLCAVPLKGGEVCPRALDNLFFLRARTIGPRDGIILLAPVSSFSTIGMRGGDFRDIVNHAIYYRVAPTDAERSAAPVDTAIATTTTIVAQNDYLVATITPACGPVSVSALVTPGSEVTVDFGNGFYAPEAQPPYHWASADAVAAISNNTSFPQSADVAFQLQTFVPGEHTIRIRDGSSTRTLPLDVAGTGIYRVHADLAPLERRGLTFSTQSPHIDSGSDMRDLRFRVMNPQIANHAGACPVGRSGGR